MSLLNLIQNLSSTEKTKLLGEGKKMVAVDARISIEK